MHKAINRFFIIAVTLLITGKLAAQQFCRTTARQNYTSSKPISDNPGVKWKFKTNGQVYASPIVFNNMIITGCCDSNLYALNKTDGTVVWKFKTNGAIRSSVAVDNNTIFFISADGIFYALDVLSGKPRWTFKTAGEKFYDPWIITSLHRQ
jgi:outer membrane protein assembly factor BamB